MRRRVLLASAAGLWLAGCGVRLTDPTVKGSPGPTHRPTPTRLDGADEVAGLERAAAAAIASAAAAPGADAASLGRLAAIRAAHVAVLTRRDPLWRRTPTPAAAPPAGASSTPSAAAAPAASLEAGVAAATEALTALRDATAARAVATTDVTAAFWGSLAASADQSIRFLPTPVAAVAVAVPGRVVAVRPDQEAFDQLVERYHEAVHGLLSLLGTLPAGHPQRAVVAGLVTTARTRRDALVAYGRAASATPTPGAGVYSVPSTTRDQVPQVAAALLAAVTGAAGVWVASAADQHRRRAVDELVHAASAGLPLGAGVAEWPGWPD